MEPDAFHVRFHSFSEVAVNQILSVMEKWPPIGQGFFLLLVLAISCVVVENLVRYLVILVRGWPTCDCDEVEEDDNEEELGNKKESNE